MDSFTSSARLGAKIEKAEHAGENLSGLCRFLRDSPSRDGWPQLRPRSPPQSEELEKFGVKKEYQPCQS